MLDVLVGVAVAMVAVLLVAICIYLDIRSTKTRALPTLLAPPSLPDPTCRTWSVQYAEYTKFDLTWREYTRFTGTWEQARKFTRECWEAGLCSIDWRFRESPDSAESEEK